MKKLLEEKNLYVKEQVRFFRISNLYDIFNQDEKKIGVVKEKTSLFKKMMRIYKLEFYDENENLLFTAKKPFAFIKEKFFLYDQNDQPIGYLYKKIVAIIPQFLIFNNQDEQIGLLKGDFFIIHGSADDNVHVQNSMEFIEALVQADKQFKQFIYTNRDHHLRGGSTRYHLYTMMLEFWMETLTEE